jgi:hypothetical protein
MVWMAHPPPGLDQAKHLWMGFTLVPLMVSWRLTFTVAWVPSTCTASMVMPTCWDLIALKDSWSRFSRPASGWA